MVLLGEKVVIFDWEWAQILPLEKGRKSPVSSVSHHSYLVRLIFSLSFLFFHSL